VAISEAKEAAWGRIAERILKIKFEWKKPVTTKRVKRYLQEDPYPYHEEVFGCVFLDKKRHPISICSLFHGTRHSVIIDPETVVEKALEKEASSVIMFHTYTKGTAEPSRAEKAIVELLIDYLAAENVSVLDHIIACKTDCFSFAEHGLLKSSR
jgi:DNA repair protein RadC